MERIPQPLHHAAVKKSIQKWASVTMQDINRAASLFPVNTGCHKRRRVWMNTHGCKAKSLWALYLHICSLTHWTLKPRQWGCFNKSLNVSHEASVAHPAGGFHLISLRPAMSCTHNWSLTHNRPSSFVDHSLGVNQYTDVQDFPDLTCFCRAEHPPIILL